MDFLLFELDRSAFFLTFDLSSELDFLRLDLDRVEEDSRVFRTGESLELDFLLRLYEAVLELFTLTGLLSSEELDAEELVEELSLDLVVLLEGKDLSLLTFG